MKTMKHAIIIIAIIFILIIAGLYLTFIKPFGGDGEIRLEVVCINQKNDSTNLHLIISNSNGLIEYNQTIQITSEFQVLYHEVKNSSNEMYIVNVSGDNNWSGEVQIYPGKLNRVEVILRDGWEPEIIISSV